MNAFYIFRKNKKTFRNNKNSFTNKSLYKKSSDTKNPQLNVCHIS
jgi:hypothetical protein